MTADDQRHGDLRRKYLNLGVGELVTAVVFAYIAFTNAVPRLDHWDARPALWSALIPLLAILVQAGSYWLLARNWVAQRSLPIRVADLYRTFRVIDAAILLAGLVGVFAWAPDQPFVAALVLAVWAFGVIEFGNYFIVRLAYPPNQWLSKVGQWRTPRLVLDMTHRSRDDRGQLVPTWWNPCS